MTLKVKAPARRLTHGLTSQKKHRRQTASPAPIFTPAWRPCRDIRTNPKFPLRNGSGGFQYVCEQGTRARHETECSHVKLPSWLIGDHDSCYHVHMYVAKVPNRGSPPAVLLRESYREAGKVKNRTLANLSAWPEAKVDALSRVLKGQPPPRRGPGGTFEITRSLPHGHVAAVLGTVRQLGLDELIDPVPSRHRDLVTAMAVAQVIEPDSKLAIARGLRDATAASSLGEVLGLGCCDEDDLYEAMDWLAARQHRSRTRWRPGTWPAAPWSFMTCPPPRSRAGPARWARSGTPKTVSGAACRSSTGC